jgi:hypothetical protein
MSNVSTELIIRSDTQIEYREEEIQNYKYTYEDVIKAAKKIKHANNTKLSADVEQLARSWYKNVMKVNNNRMLNLPEFNYALNTLVRASSK